MVDSGLRDPDLALLFHSSFRRQLVHLIKGLLLCHRLWPCRSVVVVNIPLRPPHWYRLAFPVDGSWARSVVKCF